MRTNWTRFKYASLAVVLACSTRVAIAQASSATDSTGREDVEHRVADLENEIAMLKQQIASMNAKSSTAATSGGPAVMAPVNAIVNGATATVSTPPPASAPLAQSPLAGFADVLGGATVTGVVDSYYGYNFNQPSNRTSALRLFDSRTNQFALNLIELGLVKSPDSDSRLGFNITFGFGDAMTVVNSGDPSFLQYVKEAYGSYLAPIGKGLQIDAGKFVTPNGAEVIESNANWNYSRGLLFNYAVPFYHFGLRAKYSFNPKYALTGYIVNGWNNVVQDPSNHFNTSGKTGGLSFAWTPTKKISITENWMGGPGATAQDGNNWRNLSDTVITFSPTDKLSLMANGDYGRSARDSSLGGPVDWSGIAGYARYRVNPKWAFAARYEYYNDHTGFTTGAPQHVQEVTGTLERRFAQHLISRVEYRHDISNNNFFPKGASNSLVKSQSTIAAGLIFVLEPSEANK